MMHERIPARKLSILLTIIVLALAACGVPEVDLQLPDRTGPTPGDSSEGDQPGPSTDPGIRLPGTESGVPEGIPETDEIDELEQLVSEIETLLEGVSDELDQITFEEDGG